jgi:hypothetical protein
MRSVLSDPTRSVVFLIKYLVWETAHHNDLASKFSTERPSRRFSGCRYRPAARLESLMMAVIDECAKLAADFLCLACVFSFDTHKIRRGILISCRATAIAPQASVPGVLAQVTEPQAFVIAS